MARSSGISTNSACLKRKVNSGAMELSRQMRIRVSMASCSDEMPDARARVTRRVARLAV